MKWAKAAGMVVGALLAWPAGARADGTDYHEKVEAPVLPRWFTLPLEIGDAVTVAGEERGAAYRWSGGLLPGVALRRFTFHAPLELHYRNPGLEWAAGLRATWVVCRAAGGYVPLRLVAQGSYIFPTEGTFAVSGGVMVGLGNLVHLAPLYAFDVDRKVHSIGIRIGFNLMGFFDPVASIAHFVPQEPPPVFEGYEGGK